MYTWDTDPRGTIAGIVTIVIPGEWFSSDRGKVSWSVDISFVFPSDSGLKDRSRGNGASLYYIKQGEEIVLLNTYYKFFNYHRDLIRKYVLIGVAAFLILAGGITAIVIVVVKKKKARK